MSETSASFDDLDDYAASVRLCASESAKQLLFLAAHTAVDEGEFDAGGEFSSWEIAAVTRQTPRFVQHRITLAHTLMTRLPLTMTALQAGIIDEYKAHRVAVATEVLSDEAAALVEQRVIPRAGGCDAAALNRRLRYAVTRVDPAAATARAAARRAGRQVRHDTLDDGAGMLTIQGDVERTQIAHDRLTTHARHLKTTGDDRTMDQLRTDIALDYLAGKTFEQAKVHVYLTIPATTALGVDEKPGHLAGYGWLPAQRALELAAHHDATWQRILTDPTTGHVLDVGRNKYRPPAALRDHLRIAYPTCTGPGCQKPSHRCDLDHLVPFPAGPTTRANVRPLCRPHHNQKTHGGWHAELSPDGSSLTWITKHGYRFPYEPEPIADPENDQVDQGGLDHWARPPGASPSQGVTVPA
jgi:hypothetical protein